MIYLCMPVGETYGWAICGKYLLKHLSDMDEVAYFPADRYGRENMDVFCQFWVDKMTVDEIENGSPLLQAITSHDFKPSTEARGTPTVGYSFFETSELKPEWVENAKQYDIMIAGSSYCAQVLKDHGIDSARTIIQGVDPVLFNYNRKYKDIFQDFFVVYSGGKFEFRKGQDVVLAAYKVLQDKHDDVMLINSWYNGWIDSFDTMAQSPHIAFKIQNNAFIETMEWILHNEGIDVSRVLFDMPRPHAGMPYIYQNTDIGIFPNRFEGGTNLVLMEYMACGKPIIATYETGHRDVVGSGCFTINCDSKSKITYEHGEEYYPEPNLDELIDTLEYCYQHRDDLGSADNGNLITWEMMARQFHEVINGA